MGQLSDLILSHPELEGVKDALLAIEKKYAALEEENKKLRAEGSASGGGERTNEFTGASGVLWKSKPSGGHESAPYCPTCRSMLADYSGSLLCMKCNWQAPIKTFEVPKVFHDLFGEE
ncbi:MAG: hypothetical protein JXA71_00210 [Chitinispirillaceae bacterium]|nr:hypothetical protein [Chitinispirillaceae bacterium]